MQPLRPRSPSQRIYGGQSKDDLARRFTCVPFAFCWRFLYWPFRPPCSDRLASGFPSARPHCPCTTSPLAPAMDICGPPATGPMTTASPITIGFPARGSLRLKKVTSGPPAIGDGMTAAISTMKVTGELPLASMVASTMASVTSAMDTTAAVGITGTFSITALTTI